MGNLTGKIAAAESGVDEDVPFRTMLGYSARVALALHVAFAVFFYSIGAIGLVYFNIGGVLLYAAAPRYLSGRITVAFALVSAEVIAHAWYAVYVIGWSSGFQYYLFVLAPLGFFNPRWRVALKATHLVIVFLGYLAIKYWSATHQPPIVLTEGALRTLNEFSVIGALIFLAFIAHYYSKIARVAEDQLEQLATTDLLTGLHNRLHMINIASHELARHRRSGKPISLVMFDIDDFKAVNDRYGHECGDFVLQTVAARLRQTMREQDQLARWGGEEFVFLLPETDRDGAREMAEKVRWAVSGSPVEFGAHRITVRLTAGVCLFDPREPLDTCLSRADHAMLEGKRTGKDRVVVATPPAD
jgi:diguanylate cyclase